MNHQKIWNQSIKRFSKNKTKRIKTVKLKKFAYFFKTINFKIMKTNRIQVKHPKELQ